MSNQGYYYGSRPPKQEKKPYLEYIKSDINNCKNNDDLLKLGKTIEYVSHLDQKEIEELLNRDYLQTKKFFTLVALCFILPTQIVPKPINMLITKSILPDINNLSIRFQNGIAYIYVETSLIIGEGQKLIEKDTLSTLFYLNQACYAGPYLFLLSSLKVPANLFQKGSIPFTKISRIDALTLYHHATNLLLLHEFKEAEKQYLRSYKICKAAKFNDIIPSLVDKLSLASFLNHTPYSVFINYLKLTHQPQGYSLNLWDLDNVNYLTSIKDKRNFYDCFIDEIIKEHSIRVIFDFAKTTKEMPLKMLAEASQNKDIESLLAELESSGDIKFRIFEGNIKFIKVYYQNRIDNEQQNINILLDTDEQENV